MPRDADALKIRKWAESGDVATPESQGLVRATGWPASYSQSGGDLPKREVINQIIREWSGLSVEVNQHGLLEWHASVPYQHPAVVMGSDGQVYVSVADSTGVDPVADAANASWKFLARQGPTGPPGGTGPTSGFTFEALNTNGDVGTGADQVAQGDHTHAVALSSYVRGSFAFVYITTTEKTLSSVTRTPAADAAWALGGYMYVRPGGVIIGDNTRVTMRIKINNSTVETASFDISQGSWSSAIQHFQLVSADTEYVATLTGEKESGNNLTFGGYLYGMEVVGA